MSQILSFHYSPYDETINADTIRCKAYEFAKASGEAGVCLVLVSLKDLNESVQVVANISAGEASIVLPLFDWEKEYAFGTAFGASGSVYVISDQSSSAAMQQAKDTFIEASELWFFYLDRKNAMLRGSHISAAGNHWTPVLRSAEGAAAAALVLHRSLDTGTMESTVDQPGGILEIGLRKDHGRVLGLSAGGPVEVRK